MPPPPSTTPPSSSSSPPTRGRALFSFTDANDDQEQDHEQVVKVDESNTEQPNDSLAHANQSNLINQATNTLQIHPPTQHLSHPNTNELAVAALSSGGFLSGWFTKHPQTTNELDQADANQSASKDVASAVPSSLKKRPLSFTEHGIEMKRTYSDSTLATSSIHPHSSGTTSIKEPIRGSYHLPQLHKPKHDPRDWSAHHSSTTSHQPADRENHLKRVPSAPKFFTEEAQMFSDTAEILQLQNPEEIHGPEDVAKLMRKKGISTWAAVTAFSSGAAGAPSVNATPAITVGGSEDQDEISGADSIPLKDADEVDSVRRESSRRITNRTSVSFIERKRHIQLSLSKSASESVLDSEAPPHHPADTAIDNENIKRNFLIKLARDFQTYGAPSHRIEHHMTQVAQSMSVQADFILFPGLIMISFGGEDHRQHTHFIKAPGGIHMAKLAQVNALCQTLTEKLISIDDAIDLLEGVRVAKGYPDWVILLTYPVSSFCISLLLFQISWLESVIAGFLGLLIGVLTSLAGKHMTFSFLLEFVGSLVATFISRALQGFLHKNGIQFDYVKVTLSSLAVFLPGLSLTIAIIELSTRNMVSGTVRIFGALFIAMLLGFGMTIGSALVLWDSNPYPAPPKLDPTSPLWSLLFFVPMSMSINLLFQANKHQWPIMVLSSGLGYGVSTALNYVQQLAATPTAITAIAGFTIGLTGNIYARITNDVAIAPILSGILIQVPGSLSVKSTLGFFGGTAVLPAGNSSSPNTSVVDGVNFTFQMLTICMSLAIGLFLSNLIVFPIRGPKNKYQTI